MEALIEKLYKAYSESTGVSTDTRTIENGNIFFALKGGNFNGNKYAAQALENGACILVLDEENKEVPEQKVIYVTNALKALQKVAQHHRSLIKGKIIGLTGSNGKTTTKELLYSVLKSYQASTYCTQGNLNNHIGVPLTLLSIPKEAEYAIIEMGTNQPGDIKELCDIAEPDFGLITNIGKTHLEKLISQEGVFQEKTSLYRKIKERNGQFFLNVGDEFLKRINDANCIPYSKLSSGGYNLVVNETSLALTFQVTNETRSHNINTKLFGNFNIENVASTLAICEFFGIPIKIFKAAVESFTPQNMRSQIVTSEKNTILLDAYNSNPFSLKESLNHFINLDIPGKVAIIGDMLELGDVCHEEHVKVGQIASEHSNIEFLFVGREFKKALTDSDFQVYETVDEAVSFFQNNSIEEKNILLKGSRGIKLEKLLEVL